MKAGWMKKVMAISLCLTILAGINVQSVIAAAQESVTVSGNDTENPVENIETNQPSENGEVTEGEEDKIEDKAEDIVADSDVPAVEEAPGEDEVQENVSDNDVSGNEVFGDDISGNDVSGNDLQETVTLQTEVDGVKITLTASAEDIPEGAVLWAEEIRQDWTNKEQIEVIDEALAAEAEEKQFAVQQYKAFDIKLLVDGETVQPGGDVVVKFEGDVLLPRQEESLAVYHITEDAVAAQVGGLNEENLPEMVTDHFSTYVIVVAEEVAGECSVNIHHFLQVENGKEELFRSRYVDKDGNPKYELRQEEGGSLYYEGYKSETEIINVFQEMTIPVQKNNSYNLVRIVVKDEEENIIYTSEDVDNTEDRVLVTIEGDSEVELYYDYTRNDNFRDDVTYFDYSILGGYTELKTVKEEDMKRAWEITFSTTKDGKSESYTYQGHGVFRNKETGAEYKVGLNSVLYNFNYNWLYEKITVLAMNDETFSFWYDDSDAGSDRGNGTGLGLRNTGINNPKYAYDENGVYHGYSGYFAIGTYGDAHFHDYYIPMNKMVDGVNVTLNANTNNSNHWAIPEYPYVDPVTGAVYETTVLKGTDAIVPGLVQGLTGDKYETLVMAKGIYEPGYFTSEDFTSVVNGITYYDKKVYPNEFELRFERSGYNYQLFSSVDTRTGEETLAGLRNEGNFFPLNGVDYKDTAAMVEELEGAWGERYNAFSKTGTKPEGNNCFFGMRYDFSFSLGDYVGPLEYSFIGDDDLWVFVDGHLVLDLGGIHSAYPTAYEGSSYNGFEIITKGNENNSVDMWSAVYTDANGNVRPVIDPEDTERTHQVTVLYMERGGYDSNCYMEFVLPNVTPMQSVITNRPIGKLTFEKTDDLGNALAGAEFELRKAGQVLVGTAVSDGEGRVRFSGLATGTYTLREVKAPEGYELDETEYTVWVRESADGKTITVETDIPDNRIANHKLMALPVEKIWQNADGTEMTAPGTESVKIQLYRNGLPVQGRTVALSAENDWSFVYEGLRQYDDEGKPYIYEVKEEVPEGYEAVYEQDAESRLITITNIRITGSLVITKTVDKINMANGAPVFTFRISGPDGQVFYRTITFETDKELTKSITVSGLPMGTYTVKELDSLRYKQVSVNAGTQQVTRENVPQFIFKNELTSDKYNSHSDMIINSFRMDEEGSVVVSQTREVKEEK